MMKGKSDNEEAAFSFIKAQTHCPAQTQPGMLR